MLCLGSSDGGGGGDNGGRERGSREGRRGRALAATQGAVSD
jgi:hypothetical protein